MFEATKANNKLNPEFEYEWFMESIELHCDGVEERAKEVLFGMFRGVLRYVTGYKWLEECPTGIDLTGLSVTVVAQQNDSGKNQHAILGNWDIIYTFTACENSGARVTTRAALDSIRKSMERFIRNRFDLKEPTDLSLILLEKERKELLEKHFTGVVV